MSTPAQAPSPVSPLQNVIDEVKHIIAVQKANPKDPQLPALLLDAQVDLAKAAKSIIGGGDDTTRT